MLLLKCTKAMNSTYISSLLVLFLQPDQQFSGRSEKVFAARRLTTVSGRNQSKLPTIPLNSVARHKQHTLWACSWKPQNRPCCKRRRPMRSATLSEQIRRHPLARVRDIIMALGALAYPSSPVYVAILRRLQSFCYCHKGIEQSNSSRRPSLHVRH